jgi:hypothetical protein
VKISLRSLLSQQHRLFSNTDAQACNDTIVDNIVNNHVFVVVVLNISSNTSTSGDSIPTAGYQKIMVASGDRYNFLLASTVSAETTTSTTTYQWRKKFAMRQISKYVMSVQSPQLVDLFETQRQ